VEEAVVPGPEVAEGHVEPGAIEDNRSFCLKIQILCVIGIK